MKVSFPTIQLRLFFDRTNNVIGEGTFDTSEKPSGAATPIPGEGGPPGKKKKMSKKAKTAKQRLAIADGEV
jgi:DNA helicase INO80